MDRVALSSLYLANFRNFSVADIAPGKRFNILNGHNGMGKTNLLEAIYQFGVLRSFRTSKRAELVMAGQEEARLRGVFSGPSTGLKCEIDIGAASRKIRVDGKTVSSLNEHFRRLPMVLFHPATLAIVQGGPDMRRRFMDRALYQADIAYPIIHRDYLRAVASRNAVLRAKPVDRNSLTSFEPVLANLGVEISKKRRRFIENVAPLFEKAFQTISGDLEASVTYVPKVAGNEDVFIDTLRRSEGVDMARGYTSKGPHGDDLDVAIGGRPARSFGSSGQQRMVALALKIAETNVLAMETDRIPILLLDDVSSELDREKNRQLFDFLESVGGQVFITTTHLDYILTTNQRNDFTVLDGTVFPAP